jgi:hypothetical protein
MKKGEKIPPLKIRGGRGSYETRGRTMIDD